MDFKNYHVINIDQRLDTVQSSDLRVHLRKYILHDEVFLMT